MTFDLAVISLSDKGVRVAIRSTDDTNGFWLPRHHPAIAWSKPPEPGAPVTVRLPQWLVQKHAPLREMRHQMSISFNQPPALDAKRASTIGSFPMTNDKPQDAGSGSLKRNAKKERPSQPDYLGSIEIRGVGRYWLSGWINEDKETGAKWLKLAAREAEQRADDRRQQQPAGGPDFGGDHIPFAPEWR
jgi:hypothetical protein